MAFFRLVVCLIFVLMALANGKPTDSPLQPLAKEDEIVYNPFSPSFKWNKYGVAAVTTAGVVILAGVALLTTLFFPMFAYRICYGLGGCQNTLDNYVDRFLGVEGHTRRIKRRDLREVNNMDLVMNFLRMAVQEYGNQDNKRQERENIMKLTPSTDHQIGKRSPIDYIEPVLVMVSKAYNEYIDPELKKNFKKPPSIR